MMKSYKINHLRDISEKALRIWNILCIKINDVKLCFKEVWKVLYFLIDVNDWMDYSLNETEVHALFFPPPWTDVIS